MFGVPVSNLPYPYEKSADAREYLFMVPTSPIERTAHVQICRSANCRRRLFQWYTPAATNRTLATKLTSSTSAIERASDRDPSVICTSNVRRAWLSHGQPQCPASPGTLYTPRGTESSPTSSPRDSIRNRTVIATTPCGVGFGRQYLHFCTSTASKVITEESSIGDIRTDQVKTNEATDDTRPTAITSHMHSRRSRRRQSQSQRQRHILGASLL